MYNIMYILLYILAVTFLASNPFQVKKKGARHQDQREDGTSHGDLSSREAAQTLGELHGELHSPFAMTDPAGAGILMLTSRGVPSGELT